MGFSYESVQFLPSPPLPSSRIIGCYRFRKREFRQIHSRNLGETCLSKIDEKKSGEGISVFSQDPSILFERRQRDKRHRRKLLIRLEVLFSFISAAIKLHTLEIRAGNKWYYKKCVVHQVTEGGWKELSAVACRRAAAGGGASLRESVDRRRQASTRASAWSSSGRVPTRV